MKSVDIIRNALLTVTDKVYRYPTEGEKGNYIVWAEEGQSGGVWADDKCEQQTIRGTADYFTRIEDDETVGKIQAALNDCGAVWRLNCVQHEQDTGYIHFEWVWEVDEQLG